MRLVAVVAGIAGVVLCGLTPLLPVNADHRDHPVAAGRRSGRSDHRRHRPAGVRRAAGPRRVDPVPGRRDPARRGRSGASRPFRPTAPTPAATGCSCGPTPTRSSSRSATPSPRSRPARPSQSGACSTLHIWANAGAVGADFVGIPGATGTVPVEKKPQVAGVFTDLKVAPQQGLGARIDVDTRFITAPTPLKSVADDARRAGDAGVGGRARGAGPAGRAGGSAARGAGSGGSASRRGSPTSSSSARCCSGTSSARPRRTTATTSRSRGCPGQAGYVANYYRYFGAAEAPFDWYQSVLAHFAAISTAGVWMRLPATLAGIAHLAAAEPVGDPAAGPSARRQPRHDVDRRRGVPRQLAAVQQRVAPRAAHRVRRRADLGAGRVRHRRPHGCGPPRPPSSSRCSPSPSRRRA